MRKKITGVIVLLLVMIPGITVCAGTRATVSYTVDPAYTVTIPKDTRLKYGEEITSYGKITVNEAQIDEDKCIRVTMDTDGRLKNQNDGKSELPYEILADGAPFTSADYTEVGQETPLDIVITKENWKKAKAGAYTSNVTFVISYADKAE